MLAVLTGCGGNEAEQKAALVGTWAATTIEAEGETVDLASFAELMGVDPEEIKITMEFTEDGNMSMEFMGENEECTWKIKGDGYLVTTEEGEEQISITDGKIALADQESKVNITFEKE